MIRKGLREVVETPIGIDIINDDHTTGPKGRPSLVQLEAYIPLAMQAVMNEKVDMPKLRKQLRKVSPA